MTPNLPKISVITPSFKQARFLEQTISSVLSQQYPHIEYIVMDGGSKDGTVDILKKYGKKIKWISRKDKGQSQAINKGLKLISGDVVCYLNSDDCLAPGSLMKVGKFFRDNRNAYWVTGKCRIIDEDNNEVRQLITFYKNILLKYFRSDKLLYIINYISQPATFWTKEIITTIGNFDESLHYSMDYDYWLRITGKYKLYYLDDYLALYRVHSNSKAVISPENQFRSEYQISLGYKKNILFKFLHKLHYLLALVLYRIFWL